MGWRHQWPEKESRPKLKRLTKEDKNEILEIIKKGIKSSPVLDLLKIRVRSLRGRFYIEKLFYAPEDDNDMEVIGRISPISGKKNPFILDAQKTNGNWFESDRGTIHKIMQKIANDTRGTFHGLGSLNKSLLDTESNLKQCNVEMQDGYKFVYKETGKECTVQETLYHFFKIPIPVIAEPRECYMYHRKPKIIEANKDKTNIVVDFTKLDLHFGIERSDTCIYKKKGNDWEVYY